MEENNNFSKMAEEKLNQKMEANKEKPHCKHGSYEWEIQREGLCVDAL